MITIDGSMGEGGGQVVRTALSLAAITGSPLEIVRVRERRERPGLQPQHRAAVRAAAALCDAKVTGDDVGSSRFTFEPRHELRAGEYRFDVGTAGATTLVLQTVLVPLALAPGSSTIEVIGGTHQPMAPTADYIEHIYVPALRRCGARIDVDYGQAGYYPRGGGRLHAIVEGGALSPIDLVERGPRERLEAIVVTSGLSEVVGERGARTVRQFVPEARIVIRRPNAPSRGAAVMIAATHASGFGGFTSVGRPGLPMEEVAADACARFTSWDATAAACDERLADQLVLPACLAHGTSRWTTPRHTQHLATVLDVASRLLAIRWTNEEGCVEVFGSFDAPMSSERGAGLPR